MVRSASSCWRSPRRLEGVIVAATTLVLMSAATPGASATPPAAGSEADRMLAQLRLRYEENRGQLDPSVRFMARARAHRVFLTRGGVGEPIALLAPAGGGSPVGLRVLGARAIAPPRAEELLPGRSHYFAGRDPAGWHRDVRGYGRITYPSILPGIHLVFHGRQGRVEFDFVVEPGADPASIALAFAGATVQGVDPDGALRMTTPEGRELVARAPEVFQEVLQESERRRPVRGHFVLRENGAEGDVVAFEVGSYDAAKPLVIDPVLAWSTYLGGVSANEQILDLAVDGSGHPYVTGFTSSTDYPTTGGSFDPTDNGGIDAFVTKLTPDGTSLVYSTYFGGDLEDNFSFAGIALDGAGRAHIAGVTLGGPAFPITPGAFQPTSAGGSECYVAKLSADGSSLVYATFLGGNSNDRCRDIAVDVGGRAYVTGLAQGTTFPISPGAFDDTILGGSEAFVTVFDASGALVYSTYVGGSAADQGYGIAVDGQEAIITGDTFSSDFPTAGAIQPAKAIGWDAFVTKLNATGTGLVFSTYLGGSAKELGSRVATDASGDVYVTGETASLDFPTSAGVFQPSFAGSFFNDAFVVKLSDSGSLDYATYLGGTADDRGTGIASSDGRAVVTGETNSNDFPVADALLATRPGGTSDGFVTVLDVDGVALEFSTYLGGTGPGGSAAENTGDSSGLDVGIDGSIYVAGDTGSQSFPTTPGVFQELDPASNVDGYVARIIIASPPIPALGAAGLLALAGALVAVAAHRARRGRARA